MRLAIRTSIIFIHYIFKTSIFKLFLLIILTSMVDFLLVIYSTARNFLLVDHPFPLYIDTIPNHRPNRYFLCTPANKINTTYEIIVYSLVDCRWIYDMRIIGRKRKPIINVSIIIIHRQLIDYRVSQALYASL